MEADLKASNPKTLIYAPDAQLRYIPIAALHDGNQWLTQRYAINHITAQSLTNLTAQPSPQPKILAGAIGNQEVTITVGNEVFSFSGLLYTHDEVQAIRSTQPTTKVVLDNEFSLPQVKPQLGDYTILHLATHASLVPQKVDNSFILFGNQTYATLRDIENWSLNNFDLVILSACETGLGGKFGSNGEEILGLGYQFQRRGAKATIASLWRVNDAGTQQLMAAFYQALQQGKSKTQALKIAQTDLIGKSAIGLSHPYYWSPFILIGNGL
ncbi:MAG: CHAT domain-containing protein [Synechococcales bacterium]|nr:CHAT domain-containing protein [Synechococcales bacterium]